MSTTLQSKGKSSFRWVMLLFVCLFYFLILGFCNQSFNILLGTITTDMGWEATQRTAVATAMSTGMIWFVFVAGIMMDKFSVKKVLGSSVLICAVLILLRGQAKGFMFFFSIMFLFGAASAFYMPATTKIITLWFDSDELALANGFLTAASPMGQITANYFAVKIMMAIGGWQTFYSMIGICVVIITVAFFALGKDRKSTEASLVSSTLTVNDIGLWKNIKGILKVPYVWLMIIANMCFLGSIYAGGTYGQLVLQTDPGWMIDKAVSGRIPAWNNMFSMCAYILVPLFIAKIGRKHYTKIAIICGIVAPICFVIGYSSYNVTIISVMMALSGIFYGGIVPAPKVLMLSHPEVSGPRAGTALGLYVTAERIGISFFIATLGTLISSANMQMSQVLSYFYLLQLIAPVLIFIGIFVKKNETKKGAA
ncbi:MFS family permease [Sedimentibacter acidaminivorans]|uniref:Lysosomal dipeptide transporter MFSD1 n=1 Tax=Sedimentibacter acidaminivorans TaxID=913099 RepID=A0ABS4GAQ0_9FIRM|nr:MFS transporter [Sedimentibacter acidaminivorans]MBP1924760.1 MFS family permease [Sedimentibacter acidaminivorans]